MPALVWLGRRTYGIYLFHFPILLVVVSWASRCFSSDQLLVWIVAAVTTVLFGCVLGTLGYRWIEIPGNALGKRLAAAVTVGSATL